MIKGRFQDSEPNIPVFNVSISNGDISSSPEVILDTGFTDTLKIDPETASDLGLPIIGTRNMIDAFGLLVEVPYILAEVTMEKNTLPLEILVSPGSELAGIGLFTKFGYKVSVDCKNRKVELKKMK